MCLSRLTSQPDEMEQGEGYKVFFSLSGRLSPPLKFLSKAEFLPLNTWISDTLDFEIVCTSHQTYRTGFHIFLYRIDAEKYRLSLSLAKECVVKKVKYQNVTAKGDHPRDLYDDGLEVPCVVARKIFIEAEDKHVSE